MRVRVAFAAWYRVPCSRRSPCVIDASFQVRRARALTSSPLPRPPYGGHGAGNGISRVPAPTRPKGSRFSAKDISDARNRVDLQPGHTHSTDESTENGDGVHGGARRTRRTRCVGIPALLFLSRPPYFRCAFESTPSMSYLVTARKYRPTTFGEIVGQDHV
ncbi:MAG: hypothetical protein QHI48_12575, partial [Bacteroidota bacterium]|nr:hypothetical protein [Bacteroidota bacterium]